MQEKLEKIHFAVLFIYTFVVRKMHERITFTFDSLAFLCVSAKILPEFWQDAKLIFAGTMHLIDPIYTLNQCALRTYNTRRERTLVQFLCYFFDLGIFL